MCVLEKLPLKRGAMDLLTGKTLGIESWDWAPCMLLDLHISVWYGNAVSVFGLEVCTVSTSRNRLNEESQAGSDSCSSREACYSLNLKA
jgi:hypothetical protein